MNCGRKKAELGKIRDSVFFFFFEPQIRDSVTSDSIQDDDSIQAAESEPASFLI
jgi:hypothetical protein